MSLLETLERRLRRFAIQRLTVALILAWVAAFVFGLTRPDFLELLTLNFSKIATGEWWRVVSFILIPPRAPTTPFSFLWLLIFVWIFYIMGTNLEQQLGAFRYNLYIGLCWLLTLAGGLIFDIYGPPSQAYSFDITNFALLMAVFLAFAWLNPEFTILLFFVLPVKMKWLAILAWCFLALGVLSAPPALKPLTMVPAAVFLIAFGRDVYRRWRGRQRRVVHEVQQVREERQPFHTCSVCGTTDRDDPERLFRVTTDDQGESADICLPCLQERRQQQQQQDG